MIDSGTGSLNKEDKESGEWVFHLYCYHNPNITKQNNEYHKFCESHESYCKTLRNKNFVKQDNDRY